MVIRIGMNKKTGDPVNQNYPFYYKINDFYKPCKVLTFGNTVRVFYGENKKNKRIVWLEADNWVVESVPEILPSRFTIKIKESQIIDNDRNGYNNTVCEYTDLTTNQKKHFNTCIVYGSCTLFYSNGVKLLTDAKIK